MNSRRVFMKQGAMAVFAAGLGGIPSFLAKAANRVQSVAPFQRKKTLVCIFQRGAMDGLMALSPYNDPFLKAARPSLFMSPAQTEGKMLDLDGQFALHPAFESFEPLFREGRLAMVHGVGSPNTTRSHFDAQDYMETGTPFTKSTESGWLNRAAALLNKEASPFRSVSMTGALPRSFYGHESALAINNLQEFAISMRGNPMATQIASKSFEQLYDHTSNELLNKAGKESFDAMKILQTANLKNYQATPGVVYPNSSLGNALKQIAILIKMDIGLEIAFAESGGWDMHINQGTLNGAMARNGKDFSESISAFWKDLGNHQDLVTLMTMTEFGRTVKQNGTGGTDHGRASCLFVLGNQVKGGQVYHQMKSLEKENLEEGRDLPVTTDFRAVFGAVAASHLALKNKNGLFPGWDGKPLDLMR